MPIKKNGKPAEPMTPRYLADRFVAARGGELFIIAVSPIIEDFITWVALHRTDEEILATVSQYRKRFTEEMVRHFS